MLVNEESIDVFDRLGNKVNIEFKNINKVLKTKKYYILTTNAKVCAVFQKDSFTKGTLKEFEDFLKNKKYNI